uniref:PDZ domain-containing protein n=1 Tax=Hucho hucho TaxID=62062 RepID=A0A4W5PIM9_9TELE
MSKVIQKKNHWTTKVNECAVLKDARGDLNVQLLGGAENGEFAYIGQVNDTIVVYKNGKLTEGALILEVENLSISGLPLYDVQTVIKNCNGPIRLKTSNRKSVAILKLANQLPLQSQCSTRLISRSCLKEGWRRGCHGDIVT